jgi:iron complex transport system substrate-binding protein
MKRLCAGLRVWLCGGVWLAAAAQAQPVHAVSLTDDRGHTLTLAAPPQRIVTLLPSLTETVCALGGCARVVGTDRYSNAPPQVIALPKLGGIDDVQIERIVALKPDVVLAPPSSRALDRLEALGLKVMVIDANTHADVRRSLATVAQLLGAPQQAEVVWAQIQTQLAQAQARVPAAWRGQRVYFEVESSPYAAGPSSFIGQTLVLLGMANIVTPELGPFPKLNPEYVVRAQPAVVMAAARNLRTMRSRPGWPALRALQGGQHCGFETERYELLIRPGPRLGEAALVLADCLAALQPIQPNQKGAP